MFEHHCQRMAVVEKNILSSLLPSVSLFAAKKISRETQGPGVGQNVIAQQMVSMPNVVIQESCLKIKPTTGLCRSRRQFHNLVAGTLYSQSLTIRPDQIIDAVCR